MNLDPQVRIDDLYMICRSTRDQWAGICSHVEDRLASLSNAFEAWKEFSELAANEKVSLVFTVSSKKREAWEGDRDART